MMLKIQRKYQNLTYQKKTLKMWDHLQLLFMSKDRTNKYVAACLLYSMSNAILLRFLTQNYFNKPFQRLSWIQLAQQQIVYTVSLYLTTYLWDKILQLLDFMTSLYSIKLWQWFPQPWYLFFLGPDTSSLARPLQILLKPYMVHSLVVWIIALIPACACLYCWVCKLYIPSFTLWERHHMIRSEIGPSAYYLSRPVTVQDEPVMRRGSRICKPLQTESTMNMMHVCPVIRRTKSI